MVTILERLKKQYPGIDQKNGIRVVGFHAELVSTLRPGLLLLLAAVAFVLLIACANVANLMLARAAVREREIAIRTSMGAGRRRILRQLLTESAFLSLIGAAFGVLLAYGGLHVLRAAVPSGGRGQVPHPEWIAIDGTVLAFTIVIAVFCRNSLRPRARDSDFALALVRIAERRQPRLHQRPPQPTRALGARGFRGCLFAHVAGRRGTARPQLRPDDVRAAGLRSRKSLDHADLSFRSRIIRSRRTFRISTRRSWIAAAALPGVKSASAVNYLPLTGWTGFCDFDIAGRAMPPSGEHFTAQYRTADWRYLRTMEIPIRAGPRFRIVGRPGFARRRADQ